MYFHPNYVSKFYYGPHIKALRPKKCLNPSKPNHFGTILRRVHHVSTHEYTWVQQCHNRALKSNWLSHEINLHILALQVSWRRGTANIIKITQTSQILTLSLDWIIIWLRTFWGQYNFPTKKETRNFQLWLPTLLWNL